MAQLILAQVPFGFVKCCFSCCVRLKRCLLSTVLWRDSACCRTNSRSFSIDNFQCPIDNFQFAISVCCRNPPRGKWFGPLCSSWNFHSFLAIFRFKHAVCKKTCCSHGSIWLSLKNYCCFFCFKSPKKSKWVSFPIALYIMDRFMLTIDHKKHGDLNPEDSYLEILTLNL